MRITSPEDLDGELLGWLRKSYHQMGMQERLVEIVRPEPPRIT